VVSAGPMATWLESVRTKGLNKGQNYYGFWYPKFCD
jgi:hypothetical protein